MKEIFFVIIIFIGLFLFLSIYSPSYTGYFVKSGEIEICKIENLSLENKLILETINFTIFDTKTQILDITKASYDFKDVTELVKENDNLNFHIEQDFKIEKQEGKHFKFILITGQFKKLEFETSEHFENGDKILLHILNGTPSEIKICKSACPIICHSIGEANYTGGEQIVEIELNFNKTCRFCGHGEYGKKKKLYLQAWNITLDSIKVVKNITINITQQETLASSGYAETCEIKTTKNCKLLVNATGVDLYRIENGNSYLVKQEINGQEIVELENGTFKLRFVFNNPEDVLYGMILNCSCVENWTCEAWSACINGTKTRKCYDANYCNATIVYEQENCSANESFEFENQTFENQTVANETFSINKTQELNQTNQTFWNETQAYDETFGNESFYNKTYANETFSNETINQTQETFNETPEIASSTSSGGSSGGGGSGGSSSASKTKTSTEKNKTTSTRRHEAEKSNLSKEDVGATRYNLLNKTNKTFSQNETFVETHAIKEITAQKKFPWWVLIIALLVILGILELRKKFKAKNKKKPKKKR